MSRAALAALLAAGCTGAVGTIQIEIVAEPGSDVGERIERARLTLTNPRKVIEAERSADGTLALSLDLGAVSAVGFIELEGFDAGDDAIAFGRSGPLPVNAVDAAIRIYIAPPLAVTAAPVALDPPRSEIGAAPLAFGALLAGGRDADGAARADLVIYNVYDHDLQIGLDLPEPRALPAAVAGNFTSVYLFGGADDDGDPTATALAFDTNVSPAGVYTVLTTDGDLARAGATAALSGAEQFLVSGSPAVHIDGVARRASVLAGAPPVDGPVIAVPDLGTAAVFAGGAGVGDSGAVLLVDGEFTQLAPPAEALRAGHAAVVLGDGDVLLVGGELAGAPAASGVRFDPDDSSFTVIEEMLATPRRGSAIASTAEHVVVAGGTDAAGLLVATAEVFDASTLEPLTVIALDRPRIGAVATPLANGQILFAGGVDDTGTPVAALDLFTPAAPPATASAQRP